MSQKEGKSRGASKFNEPIRNTQVPKLDGFKLRSEKDLAQDIPEGDWEKLCPSWYSHE